MVVIYYEVSWETWNSDHYGKAALFATVSAADHLTTYLHGFNGQP